MTIGVDITEPSNNQTVGTSVTVLGSYSGENGSPFVIKCRMSNDVLDVSKTVTATLDTVAETWQATITGLSPSVADDQGSYTILAWADEPPLSKQQMFANPVTGVEVSADPPIWVNQPLAAAPEADASDRFTVAGGYRPGFGLADGYVVNAYLTRGGKPVSDRGRLYVMRDLEWVYQLHVPALRKQAVLHVELWPVNARGGSPAPVAKLVQNVQI